MESCSFLGCGRTKVKRDLCNTHYANYKSNTRVGQIILERGGKCERCGWAGHQHGYHFHHRQPENRKFGVNTGSAHLYRFESLREEAEKCDLLCALCHALHHADEREGLGTMCFLGGK